MDILCGESFFLAMLHLKIGKSKKSRKNGTSQTDSIYSRHGEYMGVVRYHGNWVWSRGVTMVTGFGLEALPW